MSDGFAAFRSPTENERRLLRALVERSGSNLDPGWIDHVRVDPLDDGGMGSFRVSTGDQAPGPRAFGREISTLRFLDGDGTLVMVSLSVDTSGQLFEVDVWKTDFSPVARIPDDLI